MTALVAMTGLVVAFRELLVKRGIGRLALSLAAVGAAAVSGVANPVINKAVFRVTAAEYRAAMVEDAESAGCVGRSTAWLRARYGNPAEIRSEGSVQHWRYTPGPWFIVHEDAVGFRVENALVTGTEAAALGDAVASRGEAR